jgi:hypothetical protein
MQTERSAIWITRFGGGAPHRGRSSIAPNFGMSGRGDPSPPAPLPSCRRPPLRRKRPARTMRGEGGRKNGGCRVGIPGLRCAPTWAIGSQPVGPQDEEQRVARALRPAEARGVPMTGTKRRAALNSALPLVQRASSPRCRRGLRKRSAPPTSRLYAAAYEAFLTAGGFQEPSRIDGSCSLGQYRRSIRTNFPAGAGSQLDSRSLPGDSFCR